MKRAVVAVMFLSVCSSLIAQDGYAVVQKITGNATLLKKGEAPRKLDPHKDAAHLLRIGESVSCEAQASVIAAMVVSGKQKDGVDLCKEPSSAATDRSQYIARNNAFLQYGERAGGSKGLNTPVFSPADHGAVLAEDFVVRWRVRPPLNTFTALLTDGSGKELAKVAGVDGAAGELHSRELAQAIRQARGTKLTLTLRGAAEPEPTVEFSVLTEAQEQAMEKQLAATGVFDEPFRSIQRAGIYESLSLFNEVAAAYDHALDVAPESQDLLRAGLDAHDRIGDRAAARALRDRLEQ